MWLSISELSLKECVPLDTVLEAIEDGVDTAEIEGETVINAERFAEWFRAKDEDESDEDESDEDESDEDESGEDESDEDESDEDESDADEEG